MEKKAIALTLAIADLGLPYVSFTGQQYFSAPSIGLIFVLVALSAVTFLLSYADYFDRSKGGQLMLTLLVLASALAGYYSLSFNLIPPPALASAASVVFLVSLATVIAIASIYLVGRMISRRGERGLDAITYAKMLAALVIASALAYEAMYGLGSASWNGVDELAFNYYASYLFLHGVNPYTQSMRPILASRGIMPTVLLNGTYEFSYGYPALSFLAYVPVTALGITSLYSFIAILVFLSIVASFAVYYRSGFNRAVLLPLGAWLALAFSLASISNTFLAVSVFLLFAYAWEDRPAASGILLGLGASATQVAWFALPFFYVLTLRRQGGKALARQIAATASVFLLINIYFVAAYPAALGNMLLPFGHSKLVFIGPDMMQFFLSFYSVPYSYAELVSALVLLWALAMLYLYTRTAKPLLALAPAMIFFLSWRNIAIYSIPYVALILMMDYHNGHRERDSDMLKSKRPMLYSALAVVLVAAVAMVYLHNSYAGKNTLQINRLTPVIYVNNLSVSRFSLGAIQMNMTNSGASNETVSFLVISRSPNYEQYFLGAALDPSGFGGTRYFNLSYQLPAINNRTALFVFAFSKDYITGRRLDIRINYR